MQVGGDNAATIGTRVFKAGISLFVIEKIFSIMNLNRLQYVQDLNRNELFVLMHVLNPFQLT